ncbi:hypothetical protein B9Z55_004274 [Caenorhabditis nigoni]|uniref:Transporter n=1 Tax=Caenorhabditis nigoni TaxID=1611254 RepID=A0A2G5UVQ6_9PELO|nr:hypothetical protein B9Z55_004274 [Caenorhabditis nigoni]
MSVSSPAPSSTSQEPQDEERQFSKGIEFLLSALGMSVGLGNIWRFPTRAYENGGSVFLIPYIICAILFGLPGVYLEFALGQYQGKSPPFVYSRIMPILEGFGWVAAILITTVSIYLMLVIAWISVYMFNVIIGNSSSWGKCDNPWNDVATCFNIPAQEYCKHEHRQNWNSPDMEPRKLIHMNGSCHDAQDYANVTLVSASEQYFTNSIIRPSKGLLDVNTLNWPIFIAMAIGWMITVLCITKGMKFVGKLAYVTVILPYVIIVVLFVRGITLDGASDGLKFFLLASDFNSLLRYQTWTAALTQLCFSLSIGFGGLMNIASYNNRKHNCYRDAVFVIIGDTSMSLIGGAAVFSTLGFLAKHRGVPISEVLESGATLAFVAYPDAMNQMPIPYLWNFLFFLMLWLLGFSSVFVMVEEMCSCLYDRFPRLRERKFLVVTVVCSVLFSIGLIFTTDAGIYWFSLFDEYGSGFGAVISATSMCIIVGHLYGMNHFKIDLKSMMGSKRSCCSRIFGHNSPYFRVNWKFLSPVFGIFLIFLTGWRHYPFEDKPDVYPPIFDILGWTLAISPFSMVPICAFLAYRNFQKRETPLRGLFMVQKSHPSFSRIFEEWSPEKQEIGRQLVDFEPKSAETITVENEISNTTTQTDSV